MIHDAVVPVTCDKCLEEIEIEPPYTYTSYTGHGGAYDTTDKTIEKLLKKEGWIVMGDKHYCCADCVDEAEDFD